MAGRRRGRTLARGRAAEQSRRIGDEVRHARARLGLSGPAVARRAGVAHSTLDRIEAGEPHVQVDTLAAVAAAVGLDLVLRAYEGQQPELRDTRHAHLVDALRRTAAAHWRAAIEVPAGDHGRSADLVLFGPMEVVHLEIERAAIDFQAQFRHAREKRDVLAARDARPVRLVLAIEDTRRNRTALGGHASLIQSQLPATSRNVLGALRSGKPLGRNGLVWVRHTRQIGRISPRRP